MLPVLVLLVIAAAGFTWLWLHRFQKDRLWKSAWGVPAVALAAIALLVATDLHLQKVAGLLLMPAGLTWLALIAALVATLVGRHWRFAGAVGAGLVLFTLAGNVWFGAWLIGTLERGLPPAPSLQPAQLATWGKFDALLVLGGGTDLAPNGDAQLNSAGDRLALAAGIYRVGKADVLVGSGWGLDEPDRSLGAEARQLWQRMAVPEEAILVLPDKARITREEVAAYATLVTERGWKRVGVVTSAWHMPRTLALCAKAGLTVVPVPCDYRSRSYPATFQYLIPQERGFSRVQLACWEHLGRLVGR